MIRRQCPGTQRPQQHLRPSRKLLPTSHSTHPKPDAPTSIMVDASDTAIRGVLQLCINNRWCPIAFISKKLKPSETRYSTFDRELLAIYLAIKHFRHFMEGRSFSVLTDHKPLTHALSSESDRYMPRQIRHMDYISQFTTDISHVRGVTTPQLTHCHALE